MITSVVTSAMSATVLGGSYFVKRERLKYKDKKIEAERNRERMEDYMNDTIGGKPIEKVIKHHCLHPQHPLTFFSCGGSFTCGACGNDGSGARYRCSTCRYDLHFACTGDGDVLLSLVEKEDDLQTYAHKHPLCFVHGNKTFLCRHCYNNGSPDFRFQCRQCDKQYHLNCAKHPTRILSFLHPNHELELKTRRYFAKCVVCHHSGDKNARVYRCKECKFYVHPECAEISIQYMQGHPLLKKHTFEQHHNTLILRELPKKVHTYCSECRKKCKNWHYTCCSCTTLSFHRDCVWKYWTAKEATHDGNLGVAILKGTVKLAAKTILHGLGHSHVLLAVDVGTTSILYAS